MKRFFILTLLILFLASMFIPIMGSANTGGLTFSIGTVSAARGSSVAVPINVSNNTAGFAAVGLVVSYEADKMSFVSVVPSFTDLPVQPVTISTERVGDRIFQWVLFADVVDMTTGFIRNDVKIADLNFSISPNAATGTSFIDLSWTPAPREGSPVALNATHIAGAQAFGGNINITAADGSNPTPSPTPTPPPPPDGQYQLRVVGAGANGTQTGNHLPGARVTLNAGTPPTGQTFVNWTISPTTVSLTTPTSATAAQVTMPSAVPTSTNNIITVTANWSGSGGGNGSGGGGGTGGGNGSGGGGNGTGSGSGGGSADGSTVPVISHFGTWTGSGTSTARVDELDSRFVRLMLNGNVVASANYTVTSGSTVITLHEDYLRNFANGTYTFRAEFTDGFANLTLIVSHNFGIVPQTGIPSITGTVITMWMSIFMTAVLGVCLYTYIKSRQKRRKFGSEHED